VSDLPDIVGLLRHRQEHGEIRLHLGPDAVLSGRRRRAAELNHRRRFAVGDGRQEARRIQGRCQVLHIPLRHQPPGQAASESGYLPITKAAYEKTKADGFYEKIQRCKRR
jgi:hypothetical protein